MGYIRAILLCSIAILLPWGRSTNSISIVLLLIYWIFSSDWMNRWNNLKQYKLVLIPILFYFLNHVFGLIYSPDLTEGINDLIKKLSFFILPIIIISDYPYIKKELVYIKKTFIISLLIYFITCLFQAYYSYMEGNPLAFFYIHLLHFNKMHPSYISMFLILAIAFIYELANSESKWYYVLMPIFIINTLLLSARTEIFILFLVLIIIGTYHFVSSKKYFLAFINGALILFISIASVIYIPELNTRFSALLTGEETPKNIKDIKNDRNVLWSYTIESIQSKPILGLGTGSSNLFFKTKFKSNTDFKGDKEKLNNSHNQYLQQFLVLGIVGFISCIYLYFFIFYKSLYYKNLNLFILSITIIISSFTECILETQSGIVFLTFFYSLLIIKPNDSVNS